jgi:hypothetical protein
MLILVRAGGGKVDFECRGMILIFLNSDFSFNEMQLQAIKEFENYFNELWC